MIQVMKKYTDESKISKKKNEKINKERDLLQMEQVKFIPDEESLLLSLSFSLCLSAKTFCPFWWSLSSVSFTLPWSLCAWAVSVHLYSNLIWRGGRMVVKIEKRSTFRTYWKWINTRFDGMYDGSRGLSPENLTLKAEL